MRVSTGACRRTCSSPQARIRCLHTPLLAVGYRPIEYDTYGFGNPNDVTRLVFHAYQLLPIKGNARLLRLPTAPGTIVDRNATAYFQHMPAPLFW